MCLYKTKYLPYSLFKQLYIKNNMNNRNIVYNFMLLVTLNHSKYVF